MKPSVAVVGAGLAGLAAAFHLRGRYRVTVFECEARVGGRVFTSRRPHGEHGAEFVYPRDDELRQLLQHCRIPLEPVNEYSWFKFRNRYATGGFKQAARQLLPPTSARRVVKLLEAVRGRGPHGRYPGDALAAPWVRRLLKNDRDAIDLVRMILFGETCADLEHVRVHDVIGALYSEMCHRIRGGAQQLIEALRRRCGASFVLGAKARSIQGDRNGVRIVWTKRGKRKERRFHGAIVTSPDGNPLRLKRRACYHAYINVLLVFRDRWWSGHLQEAMANGLYTDGPLNFVAQVKRGSRETNVLRILLPDARGMLRWSKTRIVRHCVEELRKLSPIACQPARAEVRKWPLGIPCQGTGSPPASDGRIFLAGDRFGEWPSMNAAATSGRRAARALFRSHRGTERRDRS